MPAYSTTTAAFDAASHKLAFGSLVELYKIDATQLRDANNQPGTIQYLVNSAKTDGSLFQFNGIVYAPWPMQTDGIEWTSNAPPRPTITLADGEGMLLAEARRFRGLVNAKVTRILTTAEMAHSGSGSAPEIYNIERMSIADGTMISFELTTSMELLNKTVGRKMLRNNAVESESFPALGRNRYRR